MTSFIFQPYLYRCIINVLVHFTQTSCPCDVKHAWIHVALSLVSCTASCVIRLYLCAACRMCAQECVPQCVCQSLRRAKQTAPPAVPGSLNQADLAWQGFNWRARHTAGGGTVCRSNWRPFFLIQHGGRKRTGRNYNNEYKMSGGTGLRKSAV